MSKVKVSRKVFEALESTQNWETDRDEWEVALLTHHIKNDFIDERYILNTLDLKYFYEILKYGYELELTPHEIIKQHFDSNAITSSGVDGNTFFSSGFLQGVLLTLEALGEKVEGVNK